MTCSKALGALNLISVRGLDHPHTGTAFLSSTVNIALVDSLVISLLFKAMIFKTFFYPNQIEKKIE